MRTFANNAKASPQAAPAKSAISPQAHPGQRREGNSSLRMPRRVGSQTSQRMLVAELKKWNTGSSEVVPARVWHDFGRIPLFFPTKAATQTKRAIKTPRSHCEQKAGSVAEQVIPV